MWKTSPIEEKDGSGRWLGEGTAIPRPALHDAEGARVPAGLPPVVDAHVHLFPDNLFAAIWRWFGAHGWPIRYELKSPAVVDFLLSRGVSRIVALAYSHTPGLARILNAHMAEMVRREPRVIGLGTVLPGEEGAGEILREAFAAGLKGVKLHCHVQCFSPDAPEMESVYEACEAAGKPIVMHAGREPASPAYKCDPYALCSAERIDKVLRSHPRLKLVIPHLGAADYAGYERLLERHDNLWLDTTMALADYFPVPTPRRLLEARPERILYGTDFPNIPYAWDRELVKLLEMKLKPEALEGILGANAMALFP